MKIFVRTFLVIVCLLVLSSSVHAQTTFQVPVGGIALIGFDFDNDYFAFVCLVPIPENTEVRFTDNGWISETSGFRTDEGINIWETSSGCQLGEIISTRVGLLSPYIRDMNLSSSGDQIFVYQEINDSPHLIFGLNSEGATGDWQDICNSTATSTLPNQLSNLTPSPEIAFIEADSGVYTGSRNFETTSDALTAISNSANWTTSDSPLTMPEGSFSFTTTAVHLSEFNAETGGESIPWWGFIILLVVPIAFFTFKRPKRDCCK